MTNTIGATPAERELIERLMREFYLSKAYNPKAARPADNVRAAIEFALESLISDRAKLREALERAKEAIHRLEDGGPPTPPHDLALIDTAINTTKGQSK